MVYHLLSIARRLRVRLKVRVGDGETVPTVQSIWPGAGWYTDILAPFLAGTHGKLYAAVLETNDPSDPAAAEIAGRPPPPLELYCTPPSGMVHLWM